MITTEYIGFLESLLTSILGMAIVFLSLIFLAVFVMVVSKAISSLEKTLTGKEKTAVASAESKVEVPKKDSKEAVKIAVITAAISEEMKQPVDKFVITNIQKI